MSLEDGSAVFFPEFAVLENGRLVQLPVFSLAREHRIRQRIAHAVGQMPGDMNDENIFTLSMLRHLFTRSENLLVPLGAEIFGRPEEWVAENVTAAEIVREIFSRLLPKKKEVEEAAEPARSGAWGLSRTIEFMQHEYGWTSAQVLEHSRDQIRELMEACSARYDEQNPDKQGKGRRRASRQTAPSKRAELGNDGGLSSVRAFAARNKLVIRQS